MELFYGLFILACVVCVYFLPASTSAATAPIAGGTTSRLVKENLQHPRHTLGLFGNQGNQVRPF